jgi:serine/threonine-protein kinase
VETPKVLDFGVAKPLGATGKGLTADTATGQLVGTLAYMSPEQLQGGPPAPSWDLWALALMAYEMLTAAHPFARASVPAHAAVLSRPPPPVSLHLGAVGRRFEAFFTLALAADPRERPATARELLERFESVAAAGALEPR